MQITHTTTNAIRSHAAATYPEECCGVLLGEFGQSVRVLEAVAADNTSQAHRERRYLIDAPTLFRITKDADRRGLDVVGFYHSHPDHPAQPSQTDLEQATFPTYVYLIQSVLGGAADDLTAWTLAHDRSRFIAEDIQELQNESPTTHGHE
ncbi:MAG: M67 family metallopeptidase [Rhodothermia bacterium]|nr:M67 family metallopeptidase [Rhodothermia bacterium]